MRYLNKIIFINSAHVPYAEIQLDGNVHFIGTQGVGKSTLLRAILFFYNVNKNKLGIKTQAGQKGYDEFYLPHPNSYIIYEVVRETGTFFVLSFLSRGRTAFRIVDCAYNKQFFVEDDGNVRYEWGRISEQIGTRIFKSNIIRGYEEFQDILYGNSQHVAKELRRFSLMESAKYRQVPLTIQNIFLNQSLESRVIKDTIIDSMDFAGDDIDLNRYREELKNFRQQYEDIWKWYKTDKNGQVKVKTDAEAVIEKYTLFEYTRKLINEQCAQLNYALQRDNNRIPVLEENENTISQELSRQKRLLGEEEGKYNSERDKLNQEEGGLNSFLEQVKKKRQHYEEIGILQIAERIGKESELNITKQSLEYQEKTLTSQNESVKTKYDNLLQEADNQLKEHKLQSGQQINDIKQRQLEKQKLMLTEMNAQQENIRIQHQLKSDENQKQMNDAIQIRNELRVEMERVQHANPYQKALEECDRKKKELMERKIQIQKESFGKQQEIDHISNEVASKRKDLETACETDIISFKIKSKQIKEDIEKYEDLLRRQKGSLIEWLGEHVEGWENNIGKVLDEDTVLYNTSLNPQLTGCSETIYGVKIETANIDRDINTPEDIKEKIIQLEQQAEMIQKQMADRNMKLQTDIEELERKPNARLKQLRIEKMNVDAEFNQIPVRMEIIKKERNDIEDRLKKWRNSEQANIQRKSGEAEKEIETLDKQKQLLKTQLEKDLEQLRKSFDRQIKESKQDFEQQIAKVCSELSKKEEETERRKRELLAQMDAELKGLGVDVGQLASIRSQLKSVNDELRYIDEHRIDYISWQNDIRDYFNLEQNKKEERKTLRKKLEDLNEKFSKRQKQYKDKIASLSENLRSVLDEQKRLKESIRRVNDFLNNSSCPPELMTAGEKETVKPLADILEELRNCISSQQQKLEAFKQAVICFKSNFSPQNTFHFRTEFNSDNDFTDFAAELNEFLTNAKIEQYRARTSQQYATIIKRIAHDVSDLNQHNADIRATINDINRDFRENNFAGVIKEIELRAVESNDRLMQQLLNIKRFDDEHSFDIGQLNLFSNEANLNRTNEQAVKLLMTLIDMMDAEKKRDRITLSDTFKLEFKVKENDNDTNWVEKLSNVGSDGTDILVKAMVNIMLINVFKHKISRKFGEFKLHCMMDEIGKLHPNNVEGILKFANVRNIYLINSSPTTYNAQAYRYTYTLSKDERSNTVVRTLLTIQ